MMKKEKTVLILFVLLWIYVSFDLYVCLSETADYVYVEDMNEIEKENSVVFYYSSDCSICIRTKNEFIDAGIKNRTVYFVNVNTVDNFNEKIDFVPLVIVYKDNSITEIYEGRDNILKYIENKKNILTTKKRFDNIIKR